MATNTLHTGQQHTLAKLQARLLRTEIHRETRGLKMFRSRCVLSILALYVLLEEISAAVLPSSFKRKRELNWQDQEVFSRLSHHSDMGDLSVGDAGEMSRDVDNLPARSETLIDPTENISLQGQHQFQLKHKSSEKRRKVAPLDPIGRFQASSFRTQKDEPDVHKEDYRN